VIDELDEAGLAELVTLVRKSRYVVWVEAGTQAVSRRLSALRAEMRDDFEALAPCTHDAACGILAAGQESNWCHHFARPPAEVHQSRHWARFSRELGIDLRSLPYSFLVLARRGERSATGSGWTEHRAAGRSRILGRPRMEKASARVDACDQDGVHAWSFLKREEKSVFKLLGDAAGQCLVFDWRIEGSRIREPRPAFGAAGGDSGPGPNG
jgi:ribosomal protein RSM22 (predicted rRNA methylase)